MSDDKMLAACEEAFEDVGGGKGSGSGGFLCSQCLSAQEEETGRRAGTETRGKSDILKTLGQKKGRRVLVGFAAETRNLEEYAKEKIAKKNLDLIVVNDVSAPGAGFDVDTNIITIFTPEGEKPLIAMMSKREAADTILDRSWRS